MTRKLSPALLAILLVAAPVLAQQTVNLRDADVRAFIQDVSRATGRTFIIDPRVQGKVSVVSERPLDQAGYFELFLSTLRANGLVVTPAAGVPSGSRRPMALPPNPRRARGVTALKRLCSISISSMRLPPSRRCARWCLAKAK